MVGQLIGEVAGKLKNFESGELLVARVEEGPLSMLGVQSKSLGDGSGEGSREQEV